MKKSVGKFSLDDDTRKSDTLSFKFFVENMHVGYKGIHRAL